MKTTKARVVCDTNVLISRLLSPFSSASHAVSIAREQTLLLLSESTITELREVLFRKKFDKYVSLEDRAFFIEEIEIFSEIVPISCSINDCRDKKDNKFLEVAVNGRADVIITGDTDLLIMHPYCGIQIINPATFLKAYHLIKSGSQFH